MKTPTVYIITNENNTTLFVGVTSTLTQRMYQHRKGEVRGFSAKHNLDKLVYFEQYGTMEAAVLREKMLKKWCRKTKRDLIAEKNPAWRDLYPFLA